MEMQMPAFSLDAEPADGPTSRQERDRLLAMTPAGREVLRRRGAELATFSRTPRDEEAQAARDRLLGASWEGRAVLRRRRARARVQGQPGADALYRP
jgi:hypothetical protein